MGDFGALPNSPANGFVYKRRQNQKGEEVGGIVPHIPRTQNIPAAQRRPHIPQLAGSNCESVQVTPQRV